MTKKLFALATVLALLCSSTLSAYAATWDLSNGDITVSVTDGTQKVSQNGSAAVEDTDTVITGGTGIQSITVSTAGDTAADLTIKDISAKTIAAGNSSLNLTVKGENKIENAPSGTFANGAGIYVSGGSLTITGDGKLDVNGIGVNNSSAAIGSIINENMSGSITIEGDVQVTAQNKSGGAGIGSGTQGGMSGSITIGGNAIVKGISGNSSAGIGSGTRGGMSGTIAIKDNAQVTGSGKGGAGIGSGNNGEMSGSITIADNATVDASASAGAGIGSGSISNMPGSITIADNATVNASASAGAGIGSGRGSAVGNGGGEMSGTITIGGTADVTAAASGATYSGAGIGSGYNGEMSGTISISSKAAVDASSTVTAGEAPAGDAIGAGSSGSMTGAIEYFEPKPEPTQSAPAEILRYRVLDENGLSVSCTSQRKNGVLTITVRRDEASFLITLVQLKALSAQGVETIVFITDGAASALPVSDLVALAKPGDSICLTHRGAEATLTLGGETLTDVRKPWSPEQQ